MPKVKRLPEVRTRLRGEDMARLDSVCRAQVKTQTEVVRQAILFYLDNYDQAEKDARESKLEARIRKMEDRLAAMIMRTTIDTGVIYQAINYNYGAEAERAFPAFYNQAIKRLQAKRKDSNDKVVMTKLVDDLYRKDEAKESVSDSGAGNKVEQKRAKTDK